jgi:hypothetical protein
LPLAATDYPVTATAREITAQATKQALPSGRFSGRRFDVLLAGVLTALTFVVHSVHYVLSAPFWVDESWVAVSTKLPLSDAPHVTSVTPLGWTVLLRGVFFGGPQGLRLVPLGFAALSVVAAYLIGRTLAWRSLWQGRLAGALAAVAVLLAPSSLDRNDLKSYTTDAFVALLLLLLLSRLESEWTRRRLIVLTAVSIAGFLISTAGLFVAVAVFTTLVGVQLVRRDWRRLREATVAGSITAACLAIIFLAFYQPHVNGNLTTYWRRYYVPVGKGFGPTFSFLRVSAHSMATFLGMGPAIVAGVLVIAGVVTVVRSGRVAFGCAVPVLLVEMIVLGAARKFPLFDERTSYFFTAVFAVFAAIGVAGLCQWVSRRTIVGALTAAAVLVALFAVNVRHDIRQHSIPAEGDTHSAVSYLNSHYRPNDVIVVSAGASFAFPYYWSHGTPGWRPSTTIAAGFQTYYPSDPNIIVATYSDYRSIQVALDAAIARAAVLPGSRIWIVRQHVGPTEITQWTKGIVARGLAPQRIVPCSLLLLTKQTTSLGSAAAAGAC